MKTKKILLFIFILCASFTEIFAQEVYYWSGKREIRFSPDSSRLMISLKNDSDAELARVKILVQSFNPEAGCSEEKMERI